MGKSYFVESEPYAIFDKAGNEVKVVDLHPTSAKKQSKSSQRFIFRIPLSWNCKATKECSSSLKVANLLWYRAGLTKSRTVTLSSALLESHGIDRHAKYRSLELLENAGLVTCKKSIGRATEITLLDVAEHES